MFINVSSTRFLHYRAIKCFACYCLCQCFINYNYFIKWLRNNDDDVVEGTSLNAAGETCDFILRVKLLARQRKRGKTWQCIISSSPCFITGSLGIHFVALVLPRRYPCSTWAPEHGTTRLCQNSTLQQQSHRCRRPRRNRKYLEYTLKRKIWRPPDGRVANY